MEAHAEFLYHIRTNFDTPGTGIGGVRLLELSGNAIRNHAVVMPFRGSLRKGPVESWLLLPRQSYAKPHS